MSHAGALRMRSFGDDEASAQRIPGWNLEILQISAGSFSGRSVDLHLPGVQLLFEEYRNVRTAHCGTAPSGAAILGVASGMAGAGLLNGMPWSDGLAAFDARQELMSIVPPTELISLVVDRQVLNEHARHAEQVDLEQWLSQGPIVLSDAALARRVAGQLRAVRNACEQGTLWTQGAAAQLQLQDEVLDLLCPLVVHRLRRPEAAKRKPAPMQLVRRARDYALERADEPPRIVDLCRALGVSRRWLQWSFNEVMGISPWTYLHLMRLNGARRLLLHASPGTKVNDAVEAFGFWHLSRFSRDYRHHFGELPSQTLHRALARC